MTQKSLNRRVTQAAEAALAEQQYVSTTDVLVGLGWLTPSHIDRWRQGRIESLESVAQVEPSKIAAALEAFERWAQDRRLNPAGTGGSWCGGADRATDMSARESWRSRGRSSVPNRSVSPMRRCAPADEIGTEFAGRARMCGSRPSSLPRSPRSSRTAPPAGPRRSRVTRRRGAAAGSAEAQPGGRSIRTRCGLQSRRRSDM